MRHEAKTAYTVFVPNFPKCCNPQGSDQGYLVAYSLVQHSYPVYNV